ncbi:hypothetical protein G6011_03678 [Alternaria panax]|uniref:Uncharacterized protein n=1 Tax=Alternaria panax TaxID=48097 RepID=A0AAD4NT33_9PLEO|nr:hypothetical protein G6011_03678 [Alternaria panax]
MLNNASELTGKSIMHILNHCPNLAYIEINGSPYRTERIRFNFKSYVIELRRTTQMGEVGGYSAVQSGKRRRLAGETPSLAVARQLTAAGLPKQCHESIHNEWCGGRIIGTGRKTSCGKNRKDQEEIEQLKTQHQDDLGAKVKRVKSHFNRWMVRVPWSMPTAVQKGARPFTEDVMENDENENEDDVMHVIEEGSLAESGEEMDEYSENKMAEGSPEDPDQESDAHSETEMEETNSSHEGSIEAESITTIESGKERKIGHIQELCSNWDFGESIVVIYIRNGTALTDVSTKNMAENLSLQFLMADEAPCLADKSLDYVVKHCSDIPYISPPGNGLTEGIGCITMRKLEQTLEAHPEVAKMLRMLWLRNQPVGCRERSSMPGAETRVQD